MLVHHAPSRAARGLVDQLLVGGPAQPYIFTPGQEMAEMEATKHRHILHLNEGAGRELRALRLCQVQVISLDWRIGREVAV